MEDDGFVLVTKRKQGKLSSKYKGKTSAKTTNSNTDASTDVGIDIKTITSRIHADVVELKSGDFYSTLRDGLLHSLNVALTGTSSCQGEVNETQSPGERWFQKIVAYGVGHIGSCVIAQYQLALLIALRDELQVEQSMCWIYDPVFTDDEKTILKQNDFQVITHNEEGKHSVKERTLFFMPHCGKPLYNNLLWANWHEDMLSKIVIFGNSFSSVMTSTPQRILDQEASYISAIVPYMHELKVQNNFHHQDIFNNMSVHIFPKNKLGEIPRDIWDNRQEPHYNSDVEIIEAPNKTAEETQPS